MNTETLNEIKELFKMLILSAKETYTLDEVAILTGYKKTYLYSLVSKNKIPYYNPTGRQVYIDKKDLTNWMLQNKQEVKK